MMVRMTRGAGMMGHQNGDDEENTAQVTTPRHVASSTTNLGERANSGSDKSLTK
jgi:hypothetical protein